MMSSLANTLYPRRSGGWLTPGRLLILGLFAAIAAILVHPHIIIANENSAVQIAGTIRDTSGDPVANAWVTDGSNYTFTDTHGNFTFASGKVLPGSTLVVSGSGFAQQQVVARTEPLDITMTPHGIRGIYFNPLISNTPETIAAYIEIARTTEVNAVVIDIKENVVYFDTANPLFHDAGMVLPILDLPDLLDQFHANGIYCIARLVVFQDSPLAEAHPEYAVRDSLTGGIWRDQNGAAWVNPLQTELWDANIQLAEEAIRLGFDEVQYDYIRFPTDGNMARADFGQPVTAADREAAIEGFLEQSRSSIIPLGGRQSADVFGYTTVVEHDLGIGQDLDQLASTVDYVSPMIYPSHWPDGSLYGIPGPPNDYPYLTVSISMQSAIYQLGGDTRQFRPWLQDFGLPGMYTYGAPEVAAQIQALQDVGINSWLIWNPANYFHTAAFAPDDRNDVVPTAIPTEPVASRRYSASMARSTWPTVSH